LDPNSVSTIESYLLWSKEWEGTKYLEAPDLKFYVVQKETSYFWYMPFWKTILCQFKNSEGSRITKISCDQKPEEFFNCIKKYLILEDKQDLKKMILGHQSTFTNEISSQDVCSFSIEPTKMGTWYPSPEDERKRKLALSIAHEVRKQAAYWGKPLEAVCNDFNLSDPMVFSIAQVKDSENKKLEILIFIELDNFGMNICKTFRVDTEENFPSNLIKKIENRSIKLHIVSKTDH
jgi:hypothetical protein